MSDDFFEIDLGIVSFPRMKINIQDKDGNIVKKIETSDLNEYLLIENRYKKEGYKQVHEDDNLVCFIESGE